MFWNQTGSIYGLVKYKEFSYIISEYNKAMPFFFHYRLATLPIPEDILQMIDHNRIIYLMGEN